ncbi:MAG TPA: hypothetical protein DCP17_04260 [Ruminococcaceae bacterium]|nr:hypothetical protein [Oscillospiraceae bacterium]
MDTKKLFQITEAAHACGISRSTLMRMEEKGLLTPVYIAPESGRRYYDNHNIARILQIEKFRSMGLSQESIADYFAKGGEASGLLETLTKRLHDLQRSVEEIRLRAEENAGISVQLMTVPKVTCCMRRFEGHTIEEKYAAMYDFYGECVSKGYVLSDEPIFSVSDRRDYLDGYIGKTPYPFWMCVPVRKDKAPDEAVTMPECRALSVLYHGDYSGVDGAWLALGREVKARGLTPADYPRVLGIVAPYTGREIEARRYCHRLVLPIED